MYAKKLLSARVVLETKTLKLKMFFLKIKFAETVNAQFLLALAQCRSSKLSKSECIIILVMLVLFVLFRVRLDLYRTIIFCLTCIRVL